MLKKIGNKHDENSGTDENYRFAVADKLDDKLVAAKKSVKDTMQECEYFGNVITGEAETVDIGDEDDVPTLVAVAQLCESHIALISNITLVYDKIKLVAEARMDAIATSQENDDE
jgi:mannitol/fructose-specific phosphotransferase system IIA component